MKTTNKDAIGSTCYECNADKLNTRPPSEVIVFYLLIYNEVIFIATLWLLPHQVW